MHSKSLKERRFRFMGGALYWLLPGAIAFGGAIELIQPHVHRKGECGDFWADATSAILDVFIGLFLKYIFKKFFEAQAQ